MKDENRTKTRRRGAIFRRGFYQSPPFLSNEDSEDGLQSSIKSNQSGPGIIQGRFGYRASQRNNIVLTTVLLLAAGAALFRFALLAAFRAVFAARRAFVAATRRALGAGAANRSGLCHRDDARTKRYQERQAINKISHNRPSFR